VTHHYSLYGVAIAADWPLAFPPLDDRASVAAVDFVDGGDEDFSGTEELSRGAEPWFASHLLADGSTYFRWSGLYEFRVHAGGSRVACRPLEGCGRLVLQNFLFGQALAFALVLQGLEPLHATAVRVGDEVIAFLGDCTYGKSTLLASFAAAGYPVVTDDLLLVANRAGRPVALPGTGRIKLHPDSSAAIRVTDDEGEPLNALTRKRSFRLDEDRVERSALPLTRVFVLPAPDERKHATAPAVSRLSRAELLRAILPSSLNVHVLTRDRIARQFAHAAWLAARVDGFRLQCPDGLEHVPSIRQCILDFIQKPVTVSGRQIS
jgi:hypothetical protein